jgi:hypothetical protein
VIEELSGVVPCKVCGATPTIRAHIIPRALAKDCRGADKHLELIGSVRGVNQSGIVDARILCASCDQRLGTYDKYAVEFCRLMKEVHVPDLPNLHLAIRRTADTSLLVRFAHAVIFRAALSERPGLGKMTFGEHEATVREALFTDSADAFSSLGQVIMIKYRNRNVDASALSAYPYPAHYDDVSMINFCLGGFRFMVQVGENPSHLITRVTCLTAHPTPSFP